MGTETDNVGESQREAAGAARPYVVIQRNPRSGAGSPKRRLLELITELRRSGFRVRMFRHRDRLREWIEKPQHRAALKCLVAAGGDGTVADLFNRFPGVPLAVLPSGTENLLAKYLGIPKCGVTVARMIVNGESKTFDLCQMGERRFAIMASIGFDAAVVHQLHAARHGHITHFSYFQPIWQTLRTYAYPELRVWVDDAAEPVSARMAVICNLPAYALGMKFAASADGSDGSLEVRLFQRGSAFQMLRYLFKVLTGKHELLSDVISLSGRRIRLEGAATVPVQIDGDPAGTTPVEISLLPSALTLFIPPAPSR